MGRDVVQQLGQEQRKSGENSRRDGGATSARGDLLGRFEAGRSAANGRRSDAGIRGQPHGRPRGDRRPSGRSAGRGASGAGVFVLAPPPPRLYRFHCRISIPTRVSSMIELLELRTASRSRGRRACGLTPFAGAGRSDHRKTLCGARLNQAGSSTVEADFGPPSRRSPRRPTIPASANFWQLIGKHDHPTRPALRDDGSERTSSHILAMQSTAEHQRIARRDF